jgi:Glutamate-cysteine ligase family 2(GCS2)
VVWYVAKRRRLVAPDGTLWQAFRGTCIWLAPCAGPSRAVGHCSLCTCCACSTLHAALMLATAQIHIISCLSIYNVQGDCVAAVQVNLDFESEQDMVDKFRIGLALQPISTALFALSPFREGKPTGYQSWRSHVWTDVDNDRCGTLPFVFDNDFGFAKYVDYALDVPMYFVYRNGRYMDATGLSFRDFIDGKLSVCPGARVVPLVGARSAMFRSCSHVHQGFVHCQQLCRVSDIFHTCTLASCSVIGTAMADATPTPCASAYVF